MNVFLVVREHNRSLTSNRFLNWVFTTLGIPKQTLAPVVLEVHSTYLEAQCIVSGFAARQVIDNGAKLVRSTVYVPYPAQPLLQETELIWKDGKTRTFYRVFQEPVLFPAHAHDFKNITVCVQCKENPR